MAESLQPGEGGAAHDVEPQEPVRPLPEVGAALRILGLLAIVASVLVQAVELAVVGVWTGIDDLVNLLRLLGAASSQCFAVAGVIVAVLLARTLARAGPRDAVRAMSVSALLIVTVSVLIASGALSELLRRALGERLLTRLPVESGLVLSGTVALFASVVGAKRVSEPHYRGGAIIVLGCATAACGHLVQSAALAFGSTDAGRSEVLPAVFATVEWTALGGAAVFALAWLGAARRPSPGEAEVGRRLPGIALVVGALACACGGTFLAVRGQRFGAGPWEVFLARAMDLQLDPFCPHVPFALRAYVEFLRLAVAGFAFALAPRTTYPSVAVGLSLLGCSNASTPAGALAFALGTFALAVGAGKDDTAAANREIEPPEDRSLLAPGGGAD